MNAIHKHHPKVDLHRLISKVGAFLIGFFGLSDAFHIYTPLLDGTPLTTWVMAPIYAVCYGLILFAVEMARKRKRNNI